MDQYIIGDTGLNQILWKIVFVKICMMVHFFLWQDVADKGKDFAYLSGLYTVDLIIGDAVITNPFTWTVVSWLCCLLFEELCMSYNIFPWVMIITLLWACINVSIERIQEILHANVLYLHSILSCKIHFELNYNEAWLYDNWLLDRHVSSLTVDMMV